MNFVLKIYYFLLYSYVTHWFWWKHVQYPLMPTVFETLKNLDFLLMACYKFNFETVTCMYGTSPGDLILCVFMRLNIWQMFLVKPGWYFAQKVTLLFLDISKCFTGPPVVMIYGSALFQLTHVFCDDSENMCTFLFHDMDCVFSCFIKVLDF